MKTKLFLGSICLAATLCAAAQLCGQQDVTLQKVGEKAAAVINQAPLELTDDDNELTKVLKQMHNAALEETKVRYAEYRRGDAVDGANIFDAARRLADSQLELAANNEAKKEVLERWIDVNKEFESLAENRVEYAGYSPAVVERMRYQGLRWQAELVRLETSGQR